MFARKSGSLPLQARRRPSANPPCHLRLRRGADSRSWGRRSLSYSHPNGPSRRRPRPRLPHSRHVSRSRRGQTRDRPTAGTSAAAGAAAQTKTAPQPARQPQPAARRHRPARQPQPTRQPQPAAGRNPKYPLDQQQDSSHDSRIRFRMERALRRRSRRPAAPTTFCPSPSAPMSCATGCARHRPSSSSAAASSAS